LREFYFNNGKTQLVPIFINGGIKCIQNDYFFSAMALAAMLQPGLASQPVKELTSQQKETAHKRGYYNKRFRKRILPMVRLVRVFMN
jgi:hypothetical protein